MASEDKSAETSADRFAGMTEKEAAARLRETMADLTDALQKMENNYKKMLQMSDEGILEGGKEHGSD